MVTLVAALTRNDTRGNKSNDSSLRLWETNQTTFQHFTCIHFSSKSLIDGLSAEDEAVPLFSYSDMQRSSACGFQHLGFGWIHGRMFYCEEHF